MSNPTPLSTPATQGTVAGWKLVPVEPTEAMLDAYWEQTGESKEMRPRTHACMRRYWSAMLSASPSEAVDDVIACLLAEKPFWFDPATNFVHADDGGGRGTRWEPAPEALPASGVERKPYDMIVKRLLNPPFGTETSERMLMGTAADAIRTLLDEVATLTSAPAPEDRT